MNYYGNLTERGEGAHVNPDGSVTFCLRAPHAESVSLLLFTHPEANAPHQEIILHSATHRCGDLWAIKTPLAKTGMLYVYKVAPSKNNDWILDPFARAVAGPPRWGIAGSRIKGRHPQNGNGFPKAVIVDDAFNWGDDRPPRIPMENLVIYEAHLRGFTASPDSGVSAPGTYAGFMEKIPHLKKLGINAVELLPIFEFDEMEYYTSNDARASLRNFWGYSTCGFFAPNGRYAAAGNTGGQLREFKALVKALHEAGIEIILDVVYNHTNENGAGGPAYHFRHLDPETWYILAPDGTYANYSGCGNTLNANHPVVADFIVQSLRYWVREFHIDGFRFDLATALARGPNGEIMPTPPVIARINDDPLLAETKLIAEAWDAAGGYQVGSFPGRRWSEWNGKYRDDVRAFWRGDSGMLSRFATRIAGSDDLYNRHGMTPTKSINFVTCHDGFTLRDLVSYTLKQNLDNREENRDGENHNYSMNCGVEGPTTNEAILELRSKMCRNLLATLLFSHGVPMLNAGDEIGKTQQGNNNAYCQDNEISWINWNPQDIDESLLQFVSTLTKLRKEWPVLSAVRYGVEDTIEKGQTAVCWVGPGGTAPDWHHGKTVGCLMCPANGIEITARSVFLLFNAHTETVVYKLPKVERGNWILLCCTDPKANTWKPGRETVTLTARTVMAFGLPG